MVETAQFMRLASVDAFSPFSSNQRSREDFMASNLLNKQINVKPNFALHALASFCNNGNVLPMAQINHIRAFRKARKMTLEDLADATGMSVSHLSRFENAKNNVSLKSLAKLATFFGTTPAELIGEDEISDGDFQESGNANSGLPYGGIVEAGAFRPYDPQDQVSERRMIPIPRDPRYPRVRQYAYEVRGDSMNAAHIREGMWLLVLDFGDMQMHHSGLRDGMTVVVEQARLGRSERELTVKEARIYRDRVELRPRSSNEAHQPIVVPLDGFDHDGDIAELRILGIVAAATQMFIAP